MGEKSECSTEKEILIALTEYHGRCPVCYRFMDGSNCNTCDEYYCECSCRPLTKYEIIENIDRGKK